MIVLQIFMRRGASQMRSRCVLVIGCMILFAVFLPAATVPHKNVRIRSKPTLKSKIKWTLEHGEHVIIAAVGPKDRIGRLGEHH